MNIFLHKPHLFFAKSLWKTLVPKNGVCIDATLGNGHDRFFLLSEVISGGTCIGLDVQQQALDSSMNLFLNHPNILEINKFYSYLLCHSEIDKIILDKPVDLIVYNLGYLPSGDKKITTLKENTLLSLKKALTLIGNKGLITITLYPGHSEGLKESLAIENWIFTLDEKKYQIIKFSMPLKETAPYVISIQKRA